jgi:hypothetical protein
MKVLIILSVLVFTLSKPKEECVSYGCVCEDSSVVFIQAPYCPDEAVNKCYANTSKCKKHKGKCAFIETGGLKKCLAEIPKPLPINMNKSCYVTGCNNDLCADQPKMTICEYNAKADCYRGAECKAQTNGNCSWSMTPELTKCLSMPQPIFTTGSKPCFATGCSKELCSDQDIMTTCDYNPMNICYLNAECTTHGDQCGWTVTSELNKCLADTRPVSSTGSKTCFVTGCNNDLCADQITMTTCEYNPKASCYLNAECTTQAVQCGWTMTPDLKNCLGAA